MILACESCHRVKSWTHILISSPRGDTQFLTSSAMTKNRGSAGLGTVRGVAIEIGVWRPASRFLSRAGKSRSQPADFRPTEIGLIFLRRLRRLVRHTPPPQPRKPPQVPRNPTLSGSLLRSTRASDARAREKAVRRKGVSRSFCWE